jgi:hypothetical protein
MGVLLVSIFISNLPEAAVPTRIVPVSGKLRSVCGLAVPIPTFPLETLIAPAKPFNWATISFHAVEETSVPEVTFGIAPQVAVA